MIIAGIIALLVCVLAYLGIREFNRAEFWRTEPARKARHLKKDVPVADESELREEIKDQPIQQPTA